MLLSGLRSHWVHYLMNHTLQEHLLGSSLAPTRRSCSVCKRFTPAAEVPKHVKASI